MSQEMSIILLAFVATDAEQLIVETALDLQIHHGAAGMDPIDLHLEIADTGDCQQTIKIDAGSGRTTASNFLIQNYGSLCSDRTSSALVEEGVSREEAAELG